MVTQKEERRQVRAYCLDSVRELAAAKKVSHGSTRVTRDIENLEYSPEAVCECLGRLTEDHYRGSVRYENQKFWLDEYLITHTGPAGQTDPLYIKLKLSNGCLVVTLMSFHREGSL